MLSARLPSPTELKILREGLHAHLDHYRRHRDAAVQLLGAGESKSGRSVDPSELAAYTAVSSLILNLDETITKE